MTWEQAIEAMKQGKKVSNQYFTSDEYFYWKGNDIVCEMGYPMGRWYQGLDWQKTGWRIVD